MPMNETEYLLQCLSEECVEVSKRVSKALRFTPDEVQPGQVLTNAQRIADELIDLQGVVELLIDDGVIDDPYQHRGGIERKKQKVKRFMEYSRERGCLL